MSTLITNIAELMTQDLEHRVLKDAAVVIEGERIAWIGGLPMRPQPTTPSTPAAVPSSPAGWIRTPICCLPATGRPSSRRAWRANSMLRAASPSP